MEVIRQNKNSRLIKDGISYYIEIKYISKLDGMRYIYKRHIVDNSEAVINAIVDLYDAGYKFYTGGYVVDDKGNRMGRIPHYVLSAIHNISADDIRAAGVRLLRNKSDFRERNLYCSLFDGHESGTLQIWRRWDELVYRYKSNGTIGYTDYSPELAAVLCSPFLSWHTTCRSSSQRLSAVVRGTKLPVYLYQIRMMELLYGLPTDEQAFLKIVERFKDEYSDKGLTIDHLDGNQNNNMISNLFIMPRTKNVAKGTYTRKIEAPYFWNSKRIDDKTIEVEAGYETQITLRGRFCLEEYMEKLKEFVNEMEGCT